jgi:hypothetical protein
MGDPTCPWCAAAEADAARADAECARLLSEITAERGYSREHARTADLWRLRTKRARAQVDALDRRLRVVGACGWLVLAAGLSALAAWVGSPPEVALLAVLLAAWLGCALGVVAVVATGSDAVLRCVRWARGGGGA